MTFLFREEKRESPEGEVTEGGLERGVVGEGEDNTGEVSAFKIFASSNNLSSA